ncbi:hypothetical protein RRG08_032574 [Elysia crispata]|uniref:Uncharacterized protein n=1 Tax=Elysia crispata TaxID=231223 RepID=A0AAE0ZYT1_9GAST|nr:hypothetical protein RRG08_032574 [Elysia crispata]
MPRTDRQLTLSPSGSGRNQPAPCSPRRLHDYISTGFAMKNAGSLICRGTSNHVTVPAPHCADIADGNSKSLGRRLVLVTTDNALDRESKWKTSKQQRLQDSGQTALTQIERCIKLVQIVKLWHFRCHVCY